MQYGRGYNPNPQQQVVYPYNLREPRLYENFKKYEDGAVPDGWQTENNGEIVASNSFYVHGPQGAKVTMTTDSGCQVYKEFGKIDSRGGFHFSVQPNNFGTTLANGRIYFTFGNGPKGSAYNLINIIYEGGVVKVLDGDGVGSGNWISTGVNYNYNLAIIIENLDFDNYTYDVKIQNSNGETYSNTGLGFQQNNDYIDRLTIARQNTTEVNVFGLELLWGDNPRGYAFGDSITRGTGYGDLSGDESDMYINQYMRDYDPVTGWEHNIDGGGSTGIVKWAIQELPNRIAQYNPDMVILAFGVHTAKQIDNLGSPPAYDFLRDYRKLIHVCKSENVEPIGWVQTRRGDVNLSMQRRIAKATEKICVAEGIRYINAWDCLDTSPFDGDYQDQDTNLYASGTVHPITAGHANIAEGIAKVFGLVD